MIPASRTGTRSASVPCGIDSPSLFKRMFRDGRWLAAAVALVFATSLALALNLADPERVWSVFGVPSMEARFSDLYPFPAAQLTLEQGRDIYRPMAAERWNRPYNYPPLWLTFMRFPASAIPYVATAIIAAFCITLWTMCGRLDWQQGLMLGLLVSSPPIVLACERANSDLIVFAVVALALIGLRRRKVAVAWTGLILATMLKLFPVFAFGCLLGRGWRRALPWFGAGAFATVLLCVLQYEEIQGVLRETPPGGALSYGSVVWVHMASALYGDVDSFAAFLHPTMVCGGLLAGLAFFSGARRSRLAPQEQDPDYALDAFRAGAGIYVATFLLGSHYSYRLIFLLFCVPWLAGRSPVRPPRACRVMLGILFAAFWLNPLWDGSLYFVREFAFWSLAMVSSWLLGRTLPPLGMPFRGQAKSTNP